MKRDYAALGFAMVFPSIMTWTYFVLLAGDAQQARPVLLPALVVGKMVQFSLPLVYVICCERRRLRPTWPGSRGLALGLGFGLAAAAVILAVWHGWLQHSALAEEAPAKILHRLHQFGLATPEG